MATRSSLSLEVRPCNTRTQPLRTLRYVIKERQLLGRERRSGRYAVRMLRSSGTSTDSTEMEVETQDAVTDSLETDPATSQPKSESVEEKPPQKTKGSSQDAGYMARPPRKPLTELNKGDVLDGIVKNVVQYGAFIDAGCVLDVFVHVSDIADTYVEDAQTVLKRGMKLKLKLLEAETKLKASLEGLNSFNIEPSRSKKERTGKKEVKGYPMTEEFEGVVDRIMARGAIVKFDDGHALGFLPVEEISTGKESSDIDIQAKDLLTVQQVLTVRVIETDGKSGRHTLSMRPYEEIEYEKLGKEDGYFIESDATGGDNAILGAALKKAGIVRDMFAGGDDDRKPKAEEQVETVVETISVESSSTEAASIVSPFAPDATDPPTIEEPPIPDAAVSEEPPVVDDVSDETVAESTLEIDIKPSSVETPSTDAEAITTEVETETQKGERQDAPAVETDVEPEPEPETVAQETPSDTAPPPTTSPTASSGVVSASLVKELREISGAGMMDCKKALTECNGDMDASIEYLKKKGIASAAKRAGKVASEGVIGSYVHMGNKLGILLEVNSETDFVARTEAFQSFVNDVAMTIAANPDAICIRPEDFPEDALKKEKEIEMAKDVLQNKPEDIKEKIVSGRLEKIKKTAAVLEQPYIQDQEITVRDALNNVTASLGEKIVIRRFVRYELGEGLEKKSTDFATEVADQIEAKKAEAEAKQADSTEADSTDADSTEQSLVDEKPSVAVSASMVKELRQMTGGGLMDCKKALIECQGDTDKAVEYLRMKGLAGAAKKANRLASEGVVCSYIHLGSRLGIMAEINCETDFVARGEVFVQLADDIAMQLAACPDVLYISSDDVPHEVMDKELESEMAVDDLQTKPENIREKIAEGRVKKTISAMCLLDQAWLKNPEKTVDEIVKEHIASLGENIKIRRFVRFNLGEGIDKPETDFAKEVTEQTGKQ